MNLAGKKILLGVSGGIAAYKSCELLRLLQKKGAEVRVCMTEAATQFVAPLTFASLSKCPVYLKNGAVEARPFQHIDFPRWADLYLVVPATANVIGKFVYGIADDPVSLCFMSCTGPRFIAPAMNVAMFNSPAVKRNLETLRSFENTFVMDSPAGELACGEVGKGRLLDPAEIVAYLEASGVILSEAPRAKSKDLQTLPAENEVDPTLPGYGKKVLITAGRTEEAIDPVRYISNRSSGKTAVAIAATFLANGFDVSVVAGPMEAEFPGAVHVTKIKSACDMHKAVLEQMKNADVLVHCAAVADYRPKVAATEKIKDSRSQLVLELEPNPNILRDSVAQKRADQVIVGFALETDHFREHAAEKLKKSGADALLLNAPVAANSGFGFDEVRYTLIRANSRKAQNAAEVEIPEMKMGSKIDLAQEIVDFSLDQLKNA
ncbi:bifunctional phosphopantothenoylcysteine decarboxylase/phosphopantothenate--cysteine ligase CoaBC [Fibrobacter succinogenes]|uniref:Coenzyme A biosynthesis bifunctional protein CoaBC n=1 Tax=Fibrobacter succinogenes TaxID=833 RepID=A0A380S7D4_FIBSU|nr:bifunctional phosphopantothenoylcysteine decarboxylase/phosphopantothenate--cysteine ligase CoaBC [Fibrobacter succinogenes]PWJ33960.1 phosphopantothenoylcysteine decarboxylase/phosphopantothenate--cysteine ligase [Fibrobacter succinogenes subsp. elongatus]SUQ25749.1 phosphopantothenoylcysteine decarboxylase / phosphopantothenate--cysteine ligase [Fibrobacter succinogenes]